MSDLLILKFAPHSLLKLEYLVVDSQEKDKRLFLDSDFESFLCRVLTHFCRYFDSESKRYPFQFFDGC